MSIKSWKEEFITHTGNLSTDGKNKWIGVRKENLERHGLRQVRLLVLSKGKPTHTVDQLSSFDLRKCGLCQKHYKCVASRCAKCPLSIVRNGYACDEITPAEDIKGIFSPWDAAIDGDPEPIIKWLEKAEQYEKSIPTGDK